MKRNSILVALLTTVMIVCLSSCKNGTSSDKSSTNGKTDENANVEVNASENGEGQESNATPLLNATDLMAVYDNLEDTTYFKKNLASKGFKPLLMEAQKNEKGEIVGDWFTEIWGYNFSFDSSNESHEMGLTAETDDAIAVIVKHMDDATATIYFKNPAYMEVYQKQLEDMGLKHYTAEGYDAWAREGYKPGEDVEKVFYLMKDPYNDKLYSLTYSYDV